MRSAKQDLSPRPPLLQERGSITKDRVSDRDSSRTGLNRTEVPILPTTLGDSLFRTVTITESLVFSCELKGIHHLSVPHLRLVRNASIKGVTKMYKDIISYELAKNISEEHLLNVARDVLENWMSRQSGFKKWEVHRNRGGGYTDIVYWESEGDARNAQEDMVEYPERN